MTQQGNQRKGTVHRAVCILLTLLLILNLTVLVLQSRRGADFLSKAPFAFLQVSGGSMEPVLHSGDAILIRQERFSSLTEGDIIVFCRGGELIVHEIITMGDGYVITQGTANDVPDEPVSADDYCAKMVCRIPALGAIWQFYTSVPLFFLWTVLLILLLFGGDIFSGLYEKIQHRNKESK